jgi:hypothetical protein
MFDDGDEVIRMDADGLPEHLSFPTNRVFLAVRHPLERDADA